MPNPFKELKEQARLTRLLEEGFEECDGPMQCQDRDCRETVQKGLYSESARVVTWKCSKGHVSKLENYVA